MGVSTLRDKCPLLCPQNTDTDEKAEEGGAAEAGETQDDGLQNTRSGKIKNTQISRTHQAATLSAAAAPAAQRIMN